MKCINCKKDIDRRADGIAIHSKSRLQLCYGLKNLHATPEIVEEKEVQK